MFHYLVFHTINWLNWASISCRIIDWCNRMLISMQLRCSLSISFILNWSQPLHAHRNTSFDYANKCAYRNTHAPTTSDVLHANETLLLTKWLLTHTHTHIFYRKHKNCVVICDAFNLSKFNWFKLTFWLLPRSRSTRVPNICRLVNLIIASWFWSLCNPWPSTRS